ncbi:hypothetical protein DGG96_16100 [Legionella qingyii]|uniref:Uncharacterized protein n=1 Tax=Legionella qingyii TaxID=2184757 RepID=A0A317TXD5_9GAMM|nr:hypothetical protein DGG96_18465 [Legionella qingyii]PWY54531.1 hypothetical protein DGG96_16100 [Legionella qingyii]
MVFHTAVKDGSRELVIYRYYTIFLNVVIKNLNARVERTVIVGSGLSFGLIYVDDAISHYFSLCSSKKGKIDEPFYVV